MDIVERLEQPQLDQSVAVLCHDAAKEIKFLQQALWVIADADAFDEDSKPLGGCEYFITLARVTLEASIEKDK
jgi:hypothetical protein